MSSNERPCPIWEDPEDALQRVDKHFRHKKQFRDVEAGKYSAPFHSPRAGGHFKLNMPGAKLLPKLTLRQKANLSYWIYKRNLCHQLFDKAPDEEETRPVLCEKWVTHRQDCTPSTSEHLVTFLRELIRSDEALLQSDKDLLRAAGGCRNNDDLEDLEQHAFEQGWLRNRVRGKSWFPGCRYQISLSGRIHVEEQLAKQDSRTEGA